MSVTGKLVMELKIDHFIMGSGGQGGGSAVTTQIWFEFSIHRT